MARTKPWPSNSNPGQAYYDIASGGEYRYLGGGDSEDDDNWLLIGGELNEHPDVTTWGVRQAGAKWYNKSLGGFFGWNGVVINLLGSPSQAIVVPATDGSVLVGQTVIKRGPAVNQALAGPEVVANDISVTVGEAGGTINLRGVLSLQNQVGASATFTVWVAKAGVSIAETIRNYGLSNNDINGLIVEYLDIAAVIGDIYTLRVAGGGAGVRLRAGECSLYAQARSTGMTLT